MLIFILLAISFFIQAKAPYNPKIEILIHNNCMYGQALKILLDLSNTKYKVLDLEKHVDLVKDNKKIPKIYLNGKYIGGYKDSLNNWPYIFKSIPMEVDFSKLYDPEYVISKYGKKQVSN